MNIYDLLYHEQLIISEAAVKELEQLLGPKSENGGEAATEEALEAAPAVEAKPKRTRKATEKPAKEKPAKAAPRRKKETA